MTRRVPVRAMPIEKHCVSRGCVAQPTHGFGSALKGTVRWACRAHLELLQGYGEAGLPPASREGSGPGAVRPLPDHPQPAQGKLI